jgi:hypothetical protein
MVKSKGSTYYRKRFKVVKLKRDNYYKNSYKTWDESKLPALKKAMMKLG